MSIKDKIYGCLIGGACGDALGAATEGMMYWEIREKYGILKDMTGQDSSDILVEGKKVTEVSEVDVGKCVRVTRFRRPGEWTDDTTLGNYLCWKIIQKNGRITANDFADVILNKLDPKLFWVNEKIVKERLFWGISPIDAGIGGVSCGCGSMGIAPIGIINAGDPEQAYWDGINISSVNSSGENRDMGAAFACSIASALKKNATLESVIEDTYRYSSYIPQRAIEVTMNLADKCSNTDEFTEKFYEKLADRFYPRPSGSWSIEKNFSANGREYVPVAYAILKLCGKDVTKAITAAANFGRDADSIASLTGQLGGALYGSELINKEWIKKVNKANSEFLKELYDDVNVVDMSNVADKMYVTLINMAESKAKFYSTYIEEIL